MATYDNLAKYYDGLFVRPWLSPYHKQALRFITPFVKQDGVVLDVGCGTGSFLKQLVKKNKDLNLKIFGIDESSKMIKIAQKKKIQNADFQIAKAEDLPFPDSQFDLIFSIDSLYYFKHPEFFLRCQKTLKPNGYLFIDTLSVDHYKAVVKPWIWLFKLFTFGQNTKHLKLEELALLAQQNGFSLEKKQVLNFPGAPFCRRWTLLFQKTI